MEGAFIERREVGGGEGLAKLVRLLNIHFQMQIIEYGNITEKNLRWLLEFTETQRGDVEAEH